MTKHNEYFPQSRPFPGVYLLEKLEEMGLCPVEFAECIDKPEKTISGVLEGKVVITFDLAEQFEKITQIPAHFWLNAQQNYDEFIVRKKHKTTVKEVVELIDS